MTDQRVLTCEEALRFLAAYLDGELEEGADQGVERHLERCKSCFSRAEFEKQMKQRVAALGRQDVPAEFAGRIRRLLAGFTVPPATE